MEGEHVLTGIHPVREALRAGRPLDRVLVARGAGGGRIDEIVQMCRRQGVPLRFEPRETLDRMGGGRHQGVIGVGAAHPYADLEKLLGTRLLVVVDGVEDPRNLGALVRTAHAAGAGGVVIPERRSAGLTGTVEKAAAGALAYLPIARVVNVNRALETLKGHGWWIYGFDAAGEHAYDGVEYASRSALVFGGEGRGLHEQTRRRCDMLVRIPLAGRIASLNVSVAAGIALFEWKRRARSE